MCRRTVLPDQVERNRGGWPGPCQRSKPEDTAGYHLIPLCVKHIVIMFLFTGLIRVVGIFLHIAMSCTMYVNVLCTVYFTREGGDQVLWRPTELAWGDRWDWWPLRWSGETFNSNIFLSQRWISPLIFYWPGIRIPHWGAENHKDGKASRF